MTPRAKSDGRFGKQDFAYLADGDVYRCPAGEKLTYRMTTEQDGKMMRRYWTNACRSCPLRPKCTTGTERRIPRWEHEHVLEAAQRRLNPQAMRQRRETVEHPFGTLKVRMTTGAAMWLASALDGSCGAGYYSIALMATAPRARSPDSWRIWSGAWSRRQSRMLPRD
jgi:methylase of polypeptide subunit release factors